MTTTSRRLFIAAGPAAVVFPALRSAATQEGLAGLIAKHRDIYVRFNEMCDFEDRVSETDPHFAALRAEWEYLDAAEVETLGAVLAHPVSTIEGAKTKAAYLAEHFRRGEPRGVHLMAFLSGLLARALMLVTAVEAAMFRRRPWEHATTAPPSCETPIAAIATGVA
ncbi:hypothetical protein [Methylocystis parvus]|uniref:hypothetical protein n=1 Tax=Methylocystis parvus TaxID=134 RepID=UPI003C787C49